MGVERGDDCGVVGKCHCPRSASVEALAEGYDAVFAGMERGKLGGVLVGFGAAVVQKEAVVLISARFSKSSGKLLLKGIADAVGVESYAAQLSGERAYIIGVRVSHRNDSVTSVQVEVLLTFVVPDLASQGFDWGYVEK